MATPGIDDLLSPVYLDGVEVLPIEGVRSKRAECQAVESKLSYLRRLVQGRLDIVATGVRSRAEGGPAPDAAALVADLPAILADRVRGPGLGRLPSSLLPPDDDGLTDDLDGIAGPDLIGSLDTLADDELAVLVGRLTALEEDVSAQRRALFAVIDQLEMELARRYERGDIDPTSLLA